MYLTICLFAVQFICSNSDVQKNEEISSNKIYTGFLRTKDVFECKEHNIIIPKGISTANFIKLDNDNDHYVFLVYESSNLYCTKIYEFMKNAFKNKFSDKLLKYAKKYNLITLNCSFFYLDDKSCVEKYINPGVPTYIKNDSTDINPSDVISPYMNKVIFRLNLKEEELKNMLEMLIMMDILIEKDEIEKNFDPNIKTNISLHSKINSKLNQNSKGKLDDLSSNKKLMQAEDSRNKVSFDNNINVESTDLSDKFEEVLIL